MTTIEDLRETFDNHAGGPVETGLIEAARTGAARIRRRRRIAGTAAAAVLVAAVAVVVPLSAARLRAEPQPAAPAPYRAPDESTLTVAGTPGFFVLNHGIDATRQFLVVRGSGPEITDFGGTVTVHDPGSFDPAVLLAGERVTVAGHPAFHVEDLAGAVPGPMTVTGSLRPGVGWQDASGAWIVVSDARNREALVRLGATVRLGPPRKITAPVRFEHRPGGLPVSYVSNNDAGNAPGGYQFSSTVGFSPARPPFATDDRVSGLPVSVLAVPKTSRSWTELLVEPGPDWRTIGGHRTRFLPNSQRQGPGAHLLIDAGTCGVLLEVADLARTGYDEIVRTVEGMTIADCTDTTTWLPVTP